MVTVSNFIADVLYFIKNDLGSNITAVTSKVYTSYPKKNVIYPLVTIKMTNQDATRAGMQTTAMDVTATIEVRIWARNEKEKDGIATSVYNRLRSIQFTSSGSVNNDLHDFQLLSMVEVDEEGDTGVKSRILQVQYKFWNIN